jgi:hypothetical protein
MSECSILCIRVTLCDIDLESLPLPHLPLLLSFSILKLFVELDLSLLIVLPTSQESNHFLGHTLTDLILVSFVIPSI